MASDSTISRSAKVASKLPGRAISGPGAVGNTASHRVGGRPPLPPALPQLTLPALNNDNLLQVMGLMSERISLLEARLAALEGVVQVGPGGGVTIASPAQVSVDAASVNIVAGMVAVDSALVSVSGMVQCQTMTSDAVVSASYTPGAGNVW